MIAGLRALLENVVDYAGLFPPARLLLKDAVEKFAVHRKQDEAWMLRHFVIPVAQLSNLPSLSDQVMATSPPWTLSVLTSRCEKSGPWATSLEADLQTIANFTAQYGDLVSVPVLEIALPNELSDEQGVDEQGVDVAVKIVELLAVTAKRLLSMPVRPQVIFFEVAAGPGAEWVRQRLADFVGEGTFVDVDAGFKLRTGGLTAPDFPSAAELANVIRLCQQHALCWKATAGLHYAMPCDEKDIGATMHGFINLLVAVTLELVHQLDQSTLEQLLSDRDPERFLFNEDGLSWQGHQATLADIRVARKRFVSFGSCSFEDPVEELGKLG
ncbi:MAG: hypothetical protein N2C12_13725 [Planctomycetales bacterium]